MTFIPEIGRLHGGGKELPDGVCGPQRFLLVLLTQAAVRTAPRRIRPTDPVATV